MNKEPSTRKLLNQIQDKLIIELKDNEILCHDCKGLLFNLVEESNRAFMRSCTKCYNGKLYKCKHCGNETKTNRCECDKAELERQNNRIQEEMIKEKERFEKAEKISYKDYDGYFILNDDERVYDFEDLCDYIEESLLKGNELPGYLWSLEGEPVFHIDLLDTINDKCCEGYEDMCNCLGIESPLISEAQELIDKWEQEEGNRLNCYYQNYSRAIIIKDLIEEIREDIKNNN